MTGMTRSSEGLDPRRRKLLFMCWHRGIREMDLIMGRFADENIGVLSESEVSPPFAKTASRGLPAPPNTYSAPLCGQSARSIHD